MTSSRKLFRSSVLEVDDTSSIASSIAIAPVEIPMVRAQSSKHEAELAALATVINVTTSALGIPVKIDSAMALAVGNLIKDNVDKLRERGLPIHVDIEHPKGQLLIITIRDDFGHELVFDLNELKADANTQLKRVKKFIQDHEALEKIHTVGGNVIKALGSGKYMAKYYNHEKNKGRTYVRTKHRLKVVGIVIGSIFSVTGAALGIAAFV